MSSQEDEWQACRFKLNLKGNQSSGAPLSSHDAIPKAAIIGRRRDWVTSPLVHSRQGSGHSHPQLHNQNSQSGNKRAKLNPTRNGFISRSSICSLQTSSNPQNVGENRKIDAPFRKTEGDGAGRSSGGNAP